MAIVTKKKEQCCSWKDQPEMWGIIKKGQLKTGYCRPNAVPLRLRRNHNFFSLHSQAFAIAVMLSKCVSTQTSIWFMGSFFPLDYLFTKLFLFFVASHSDCSFHSVFCQFWDCFLHLFNPCVYLISSLIHLPSDLFHWSYFNKIFFSLFTAQCLQSCLARQPNSLIPLIAARVIPVQVSRCIPASHATHF